jgi:hypothetical protein
MRFVGAAKGILRVTCGVVVAAAVLEVVIRHVYHRPTVFDPVLGYVVAPGSTVTWAREGEATSRWTAYGLRRAREPDKSVPAVLTLGDSFTEAFMVDDDNVFTHRLEQLLRADGVRVEVLNAGRSGTSAADYVALAAHYRRLFAPRWTVIELRDEDLGSGAWMEGTSHFVNGVDNSVSAVFMPPARHQLWDRLRALRTHSALVDYACIRLREFAEAFGREPPLFHATAVTAQAAHPPDDRAPRYPITAELRSLHEAYDGRVTFLYLPDFDLRHPATPASGIEQQVEALCHEQHWSCVNLRTVYARFAARYEAPFGFANSGFNLGHLNAAGHRAAADLLHAELLQLPTHDLL